MTEQSGHPPQHPHRAYPAGAPQGGWFDGTQDDPYGARPQVDPYAPRNGSYGAAGATPGDGDAYGGTPPGGAAGRGAVYGSARPSGDAYAAPPAQDRYDPPAPTQHGGEQYGYAAPAADQQYGGYAAPAADRFGAPQHGYGTRQHAPPGRHGADSYGADPNGTEPYGADPYGADPYGADRYGADRYGAAPESRFAVAAEPDRHTAPAPPVAGGAGAPPRAPVGQPAGSPPPTSPPASRPAGVNGFAVASLVLGIVGGVLLSVVFGFVALAQIKKRGQRGRGLAVGGLTLSALWVLGLAAAVVVAVLSGAGRDDAGAVTEGGTVASSDFKAGDCLNGLTQSDKVTSLPAVPCAEPHDGEVFATFEIGGGDFPGDDGVRRQAEAGCVQRLAEYSAKAAADEKLEIYFLHPTEQSWARGDHEVTCVAMDPAKRTGSLKD